MDAAISILVEDPERLTLPGVARAAGVSVPTAYRHFATLDALEVAIMDRYRASLHADTGEIEAGDRRALRAALPRMFRNYEAMPAGLRRLAASAPARRDRAARRDRSREWIGRHLGPGIRHAPAREAAMAIDVATVLCSTGAVRLFEEYLGLGASETSARVLWVLDLLHAWADAHLPDEEDSDR